MLKKISIILFIFFSTLFICSFSFATANNIKNTINNGTNTVIDGMNNLGADVRSGIGNLENGIEDALTNDDNNNNMENNNETAQSATSTTTKDGARYSVERTGDTDVASATDTNNMWVWIVLIIATVVIIGLIWYYSTQDNK